MLLFYKTLAGENPTNPRRHGIGIFFHGNFFTFRLIGELNLRADRPEIFDERQPESAGRLDGGILEVVARNGLTNAEEKIAG